MDSLTSAKLQPSFSLSLSGAWHHFDHMWISKNTSKNHRSLVSESYKTLSWSELEGTVHVEVSWCNDFADGPVL